jgi:ATP-dependent Clp protease ATP-binding subunit ClpC
MYEQLSHNVERIIKAANRIARDYELEYVGTEHVLLGIAAVGEGHGARILQNHKLDEHRIKVEVDSLVQKSMEDTWVFGRLPGSPHFRNVIAGAIEEARNLGSKEVRAEHLLLALLREKGSVACKALTNLGLRLTDVRKEIAQLAKSE